MSSTTFFWFLLEVYFSLCYFLRASVLWFRFQNKNIFCCLVSDLMKSFNSFSMSNSVASKTRNTAKKSTHSTFDRQELSPIFSTNLFARSVVDPNLCFFFHCNESTVISAKQSPSGQVKHHYSIIYLLSSSHYRMHFKFSQMSRKDFKSLRYY